MPIAIDYDKCCWKNGVCVSCGCSSGACATKCEGCVEACPSDALRRESRVVIIAENCVDCGACVAACPKDAITMV